MQLSINYSTVGGYGGSVSQNLRYFVDWIGEELDKNNFKSSFEVLEIALYYPPMYVGEGIKGMEVSFNECYLSFPSSRIDRKNRRITIYLQAPQFSDHIQSEKAKGEKYQFEIEDQYKNLTEEYLAHVILDKCIEGVSIIQPKLKKEDDFDTETFRSIITSIRPKISPEFLNQTQEIQSTKQRHRYITGVKEKRESRRNRTLPPTIPIRDIRVYASNKEWDDALNPYAYYYCRILLNKLYNNGFKCPVYHHLYIQVAESEDDALYRTSTRENWFVYGIAVFDFDKYNQLSDQDKPKAVFNLIVDGLKDIAAIDKLDMDILEKTIREIKETDLDTELFYKTAENAKYHLQVSYKMNPTKKGFPVIFTLTDKAKNIVNKKVAMHFKNTDLFIDKFHYTFNKISISNKEIKIKASTSIGADVYLGRMPREYIFKIDEFLTNEI